jgi:hypothetical protein
MTTDWSAITGRPFVTVSTSTTNDGSDYGAFTSGTTTCGIQEAINSGSPVMLRNGTFPVSTQINVTAATIIVGQGPANTVIQMKSGSNLKAVIYAAGTSTTAAPLNIRDLTIDGNAANQTSGMTGSGALWIGIYADYSTITNLLIKNSWDVGLFISSSTPSGGTVTSALPEHIAASQVVTNNCGVNGTKTGAGFDNGSGSRVVLTNYVGEGNATGVVLTDIGAGADTVAAGIFVSGSLTNGIYNGSDCTVSDFRAEFSGQAASGGTYYGLFLDGGDHFVGTAFWLSNNSGSGAPTGGGDVYVAQATPPYPYRLEQGYCTSSIQFVTTYLDNAHVLLRDIAGYTPRGFAITTPAAPGSGLYQTNTFPFPVRVYISGYGNATQLLLKDPSGNGTTFGTSSAIVTEVTLDPGGQIGFGYYTSAPTYVWYGT